MRVFGIFSGLLLTAYGLVETIGAVNPMIERELCEHWACWNRDLAEETYQKFTQGTVGTRESVSDLTKELVRDSVSSFRWCDLADALLASGQTEKARYCMRRALALGPNYGSVLLRVANFDFAVNSTTDGLHALKHLIEIAPDYDAIVFSNFDRFGGGTEQVLALGVPDEIRAAQAFLRHLIATRRAPEEIARTWAWLTARSLTDGKITVEYVNYLVAARQFDDAVAVWGKASGEHAKEYMRTNHVFNGDFEYAPTGALLDWNVSVPEAVTAEWDTAEHRSGSRSLRLDFNAQDNLTFNGVFQQVIVSPGAYRFQASVKADSITTNQGVGFHIVDAEVPARLDVAAEPLTGTVPWIEQELSFTVPPQTRSLRVELRRQPSRKLDNKIHGRFWCDRVILQSHR